MRVQSPVKVTNKLQESKSNRRPSQSQLILRAPELTFFIDVIM